MKIGKIITDSTGKYMNEVDEAFDYIKNIIDMEEACGNHIFKDQNAKAAWRILVEFFSSIPDDFNPLDFSVDESIKF